MPGKLCFGEPDHTAGAATLSQSKAFCEGRQSQATGGAVGDNPHPSGSPDNVAWGKGFAAAVAGDPKGCCAL